MQALLPNENSIAATETAPARGRGADVAFVETSGSASYPPPSFLQNTFSKRLSSFFRSFLQCCTQYVVFGKFEVPRSCLLLFRITLFRAFCRSSDAGRSQRAASTRFVSVLSRASMPPDIRDHHLLRLQLHP